MTDRREQYQCLDCHTHDDNVSVRSRVFSAERGMFCPTCGSRSVVPVVDDPRLTTDEAGAVKTAITFSLHGKGSLTVDEIHWLEDSKRKFTEVLRND